MNVWITGASTGIGRALCIEYARSGHHIIASARSLEKLNTLKEDIQLNGGKVMIEPVDICNLDQVRNCCQAIENKGLSPDLVILNAGTHIPTSAEKFSLADHNKLMEINYTGTLNCLNFILPHFLERNRGKIAIVSSVAGYRGLPYASGYGASKAALINLCESMRPELLSHNIDLRLISPGFVKTPLTDRNKFPMPFIVTADNAAMKIMKGLEKSSFEITFPRFFTAIMKSLRCIPNFVFFYISRKMLRK